MKPSLSLRSGNPHNPLKPLFRAAEAISIIIPYLQCMKPGYIYILTNKKQTVLYVGVTSNLMQRISEHKSKKYQNSFTARYHTDQLVYWEYFEEIGAAIRREKQLKGGSRQKKVDLINSFNPQWIDLQESITDFINPLS